MKYNSLFKTYLSFVVKKLKKLYNGNKYQDM